MYCHECGTANTVDSKYCKECGVKINEGFRTMMLSVQDLAAGQSEEALDRLTRLLDMAFWHNQAGNVDAAITASEAALAINPNSTTAHSLLGTLYEKKGEDAKAILHFESVLALNPDSPADAAKLDQLRRGVHVKPVTPPVVYLWLPPALGKFAPRVGQIWTSLVASGARRPIPPSRRPLYAAGAAGVFVLASGLLLTRPWARADAVTVTPVRPAAPVLPAASSVVTGPAAPLTSAFLPPMILTPNRSSAASSPAQLAWPAHDPFAGRVPSAPPVPRIASSRTWYLPPVPPRPPARRRRLARRDLPTLPLTLTAISDSESGQIAPAPVALPDGGRPLATVGSIPQHTVMVRSLGSAPDSGPSNTPDLPQHIHITVHQIRAADSDSSPASSDDGSGAEGARGDSYQQRALALQQGGEYRQARLAYQNAIRAYEAQIASGRDVETAQRGLAACQTGLQICQQSQ